MSTPVKPEWSKSYLMKPKDHLISHIHIAQKVKPFLPSYMKECSENMNWLIGMEYGRIWLKERNEIMRKRAMKRKPIKNDYKNWIAKRKKKSKETEVKKTKL